MMLTPIIHKIKDRIEKSRSSLWNYRISGNQIELIVVPNYLKEPERYRRAIINAGRALQEIQLTIESEGDKAMIQTFPSIDETQLVATIRILKDDYSTVKGFSPVLDQTKQDLFKSIANQFGLFISVFDCSLVSKIEALNIPDYFSDPDNCEKVFILQSMRENPFIWLKTGMCLNRIETIIQKGSNTELTYNFKIPAEYREMLPVIEQKSRFNQAIIFTRKRVPESIK
jgi:hypothetical protein